MLNDSGKAEDVIGSYSKVWNATIQSKYGLLVYADSSSKLTYKDAKLEDTFGVYSTKDYYAKDFSAAVSLARDVMNKDKSISKLMENKLAVSIKMKSLNTPPEEYRVPYEIAFEMYGYYDTYVSLADSPTGSLSSFNQKTNELSSNIVKKMKEFQVRLPNK